MIEVITQLDIFSFDGRVLEVFESNGESKRYHLAFIQKIELEDRGRKGHRVNISYSSFDYPVILGVRDDDVPQMQQLVTSITNAIR